MLCSFLVARVLPIFSKQYIDNILTLLCRANSRLKRLRLGYWWDTPDLVLREVSEETTLEELQLVCCPYLTDATVAKILDGCKSLQSLFLYIDELLTAETLRAYSKTGRKVKLEIGECSGLDRDKLTDEMRHLRNIIVE